MLQTHYNFTVINSKGLQSEIAKASNVKLNGYISMRAAGSHGKYDVVGYNPLFSSVKFIQCKTKKGTPPSFQPYEISKRTMQTSVSVETLTYTKYIA